MKKLLLSLASVALFAGASFAEEVTLDFSNVQGLPTSESAEVKTVTSNGIDVSMKYCKKGTYSNQTYLQVSGKSYTGAYVGFTLPQNCSQFVITTGSNASASVKVQLSAGGTNIGDAVLLNEKGGNFTFSIPAANQSAGTEYRLTVSNKYNAQISKVVFTVDNSGKELAGLSFPQASYDVIQGTEFTAPELTKATDAPATYSSTDEAVATVNAATGEVTILGLGTTVIKAVTEETDTYAAGSAEYTLNVIEDPKLTYTLSTAHPIDMLGETETSCVFEYDNGELPAGVTYVWGWKSNSGKYYLNASAYVGGKAYAVDAYAISPVLYLTGVESASVSFEHAAKFQNGVMAEECTFVVREVTETRAAGEWTTLPIPVYPEAGDWIFANSGEIDLTAFAGKNIQIGFRYNSTSTAADTWEIRNVHMTGSDVTGIADVEAAEGEVMYFNLQGVRVANPESGLYIRVQGGKATKVMIRK